MDKSQKNRHYFVHAVNESHLSYGEATGFTEILRQILSIDVIILPLEDGSELTAATAVS
ncbi:hypothetical protein [Enterococcus pallens]|uniref:Uncharacterized protein n=1 Tax=Enterococcus pallens ATCC BAA-351 TaxID=1158607 RepID=R2QDK4_9ENTE|nr:hypothetical protein [Enterococcus pallens]EOH94467.1 hypothetical protein UAU_02202 [Enterococcus pallens ATCC BAA-351]EOU24346.1 hypothetical protein I588_00333 [Enterococcus pallens ATCC BAA-351]